MIKNIKALFITLFLVAVVIYAPYFLGYIGAKVYLGSIPLFDVFNGFTLWGMGILMLSVLAVCLIIFFKVKESID